MTTPRDSGELLEIEALVSKLARRIRTQRAIQYGVTAGVFAIMGLMVSLVLFKTGWLEQGQLVTSGLVAGALVLVCAALGAARKLDRIALAQQIDRSHGLHDRLSSALSFAGEEDVFEDVYKASQIKEAGMHVGQVDLAIAAPFERPADLIPLVLFLLAFGMLGVFRAPSHQHPLPPAPVFENRQILDDATIAIEKDRLEEMKKLLEEVDDPEIKEIVEEIDDLLEDVEDRELTEKEFLERLDKIEKKLDKQEKNAEALEEIAAKLKETIPPAPRPVRILSIKKLSKSIVVVDMILPAIMISSDTAKTWRQFTMWDAKVMTTVVIAMPHISPEAM